MTTIETPRLTIRRLTKEDVPAMVAIYGDPETVRFVGDSAPLTMEECGRWVDVTDRNFEARGYGMVALVERATGRLVGCGGVVHPGGQEEPEIKYAIRRDRWGEGFATEAVPVIVATVYPGNAASQRVLPKTGFVRSPDRTWEEGRSCRSGGCRIAARRDDPRSMLSP